MAKLGRRRLILISIEDTPGVAKAGATTLWTYDATMDDVTEIYQREFNSAYGGQAKAVRGSSIGTCKFRCEVRSDGAGALDAGILIAFQGCGMKNTAGSLAPVTAIAQQKTVTLDLFKDGKKTRLFGAMGTYQLSGDLQKIAIIEFTFSGRYHPLGDAALPSTAPPTGSPMRVTGLTFGAYSPKFSKVSLNPNTKAEPREDQAATPAFEGDAAGIGQYLIGPGRRYMIEFDPEQESAGGFDVEALAAVNTEAAAAIVLSDGTVETTIAAAKAQILSPAEGTRESKAINNVQLQCNGNLGDDEVVFTTAAA